MIITFDEEKHVYTNEKGEVIPSVTQILGTVYGTGLENAPSYFIERAAEKGTKIHKEIEAYLNNGEPGKTPEFNAWFEWFNLHKFGDYKSEEIIFAQTPFGPFAGTLDFFANKVFEWKTCKTATRKQIDKWQKQLSFYIYAKKQVDLVSLLADIIHITDKVEVIEVPYLGDEFVEETMRLYAAGETPKEETYELETVSKKELQTLEDVLLQMDALQLVIDEYRKKALEEMERRGILNIQVGKVKMTYVPGTVRDTFDSKAFKAAEPDLYEKYIKKTEVKPSLRITVK